MRVLVTGGAGYIGSTVAQELLAADHNVTIYDSLVHGHGAAVPEGARFVQGDILDSGALDLAFEEGHFDAVMHSLPLSRRANRCVSRVAFSATTSPAART